MRIAVPIWENKLSPVLDSARYLLVVDAPLSEGRMRFETCLSELDMGSRVQLMVRFQVEVLICGAVSRPFSELMKANGIQVISGISGPSEKILDAFFSGNLDHTHFLMPGYGEPAGS